MFTRVEEGENLLEAAVRQGFALAQPVNSFTAMDIGHHFIKDGRTFIAKHPVVDNQVEFVEVDEMPTSIVIYGKRMVAIGRGKYPYDCNIKDWHPSAMIYRSDCTWLSSGDELFTNRDKAWDEYDEKQVLVKLSANYCSGESLRHAESPLFLNLSDIQEKGGALDLVLDALLGYCRNDEKLGSWQYEFTGKELIKR